MSVIERVKATLGSYSDADVRSILHADHERIRELAKELAETDSAPRRRTLVRQLKPLLTAHSRAEEQTVYTPLMQRRDSPDSRLAGNEGMVEHNLADIVIERMYNTADTAADMWRAHAKVLNELLTQHIDEEEKDVFEELGEHFSDEQREAMGQAFARGRDKLLQPGSPARAPERRSTRAAPRRRGAAAGA
jgi:hemerythrin superfamily protein